MNKIKSISAFLLLFSAVIFTSCSVEPYTGSIPSSGDNGGNESANDYWPSAINNQWVFSLNGVNQAPLKMVSIDAIGGNSYFTFNPQSNGGVSQVTRLRKLNGDYYIKSEDIIVAAQAGVPGSTSTGTERILLKDYLPVGGSWTSDYVQTTTYTDPTYPVVTTNFNIVATILEKGSTLTVGSQTFNDVIKVRVVQNITFSGQISSAISYYWYAKNVGSIKIETTSGTTTYTQDLVSYILN
ncbi:MAG: hypothetical protein ABI549_13545 [Flavobacterium sp.]|uniref:hypothetical protein n=1 Tax=Flavobacterium sp. TaxID=239 RepID=UPI0032670A5C